MQKIQIAALAILLVLGGCASAGDKMSGDKVTKASVEAMIKSAEAANKAAGKVGGMWRDAGKEIKAAKAALSKGDLKTAMKKAKFAKFQGEQGQAQAKAEAKAGPWLF